MGNFYSISAVARTAEVTSWEGTHRVEIDWTFTPHVPVQVLETRELYLARGGWPIWLDISTGGWRGNPPQISSTTVVNESLSEVNPVVGRLVQVSATTVAPPNTQEDVTLAVAIACDVNTVWAAGIEQRPDVFVDAATAPPDFLPQGDLQRGRMIGLMGPVEALDLIVPSGPSRKRQRTLIVSGMLMDLNGDPRFVALLRDPKGNAPRRWQLTLRDHATGTTTLDEALSFRSDWPGFDGATLRGPASTDRFGAFHYGLPISEDFTTGRLRLELDLGDFPIAYECEVAYSAADTLHLPVDPTDRVFRNARVNFGNGPGEPGVKATSHNGDPKQRYAYDLGVRINRQTRAPGDNPTLEDYYAFRQPVLALADGTVIHVKMDTDDRLPSLDPPEPNRVVVQHAHPDGARYSVYAHCRRNSARVAVGDIVSAGQPLAEIGNNGSSSEPHLHLAYYMYDAFGRMRLLPMAFTVADGMRGRITGVPRSDQELEPPVGTGAEANRPVWRQLIDAMVAVVEAIVNGFRRVFGGG